MNIYYICYLCVEGLMNIFRLNSKILQTNIFRLLKLIKVIPDRHENHNIYQTNLLNLHN